MKIYTDDTFTQCLGLGGESIAERKLKLLLFFMMDYDILVISLINKNYLIQETMFSEIFTSV